MVGRYAVIELVGTMFLTVAVAVTGDMTYVGLTLMAMVYIGGHISGGHYNPAISLTSWMRGGLSNENLLTYSIVQIVGAVLGLYIAATIPGSIGMSLSAGSEMQLAPLMLELLFTMAFALLVLTVSRVAPYKSSSVAGLIVGLSYAALVVCGGNALLNPALALGAVVCSALNLGSAGIQAPVLMTFVVGPLIGAAAAAWVFSFLNDSAKR